MVPKLQITKVFLVFAVSALVCAAQTLSPGEVRINTQPYHPGPALRSVRRLVQLEVVVRDRHGRAVPGFTKDDFSVFDVGNKRELTAFSVQTFTAVISAPAKSSNAPKDAAPEAASPSPPSQVESQANGRWIALFFDDINTASGDLAHAKIAATRLIREAIGSGDRIAIFTTSGGRVSEFTNDSTSILAIIAKVQSHPRASPGGLALCPRITAYEAYQIVNNDPTAMQAKVDEACHCGGTANCDVSAMRPSELMNPTSSGGNAYGGAGTLSSLISSVKAQAQMTWDQARLASQATLDAVKASLDQLANRSGRRMLLFASSGFLSATLDEQQDSIVNEALHAGVVINSLDAKGLYAEAPGIPINESVEVVELPVSSIVFQVRTLGERLDSLDSAMARFAESTGGLLFRDNNDLDLGFYRLGILPTTTYLLGFTPAEDGKYHKIKLEVKNASRDFVQVRPGYFAPTAGSNARLSPTEKLDAVMRESNEKTDLPATVTEQLEASKSGGRQLIIQTHVDVQRLPFQQQKDRHVQRLTFVAALFDSQGNFVTGKHSDMDLALKQENFDRFSTTGINGMMSLEAPPGTYRMRVVVEEAVHGTVCAISRQVEIR
jgi:VWFA-related protein